MPTSHTRRDTLFELVEAAVASPARPGAPSWSVTLDAEGLRRFADQARVLAITDPDDREVTISCGAALYNLVVASRSHGLEADIRMGAGGGPTVEVRSSSAPADHRLADAIDLRRTPRQSFRDEPVPDDLVRRLVDAVAAEGGAGVVAEGDLRAAVADLVAEGDRLHFAGRRWRRPAPPTGGPAHAVARHVVSAFDVGARAAHHDRELAVSAPLLVVVATPGDTSADWLAAGEGLEHLLLEAAAAGLQGSFLNQPCQVPELRERLRALLPGTPWPQVIVRVGYPGEAPGDPGGSGR